MERSLPRNTTQTGFLRHSFSFFRHSYASRIEIGLYPFAINVVISVSNFCIVVQKLVFSLSLGIMEVYIKTGHIIISFSTCCIGTPRLRNYVKGGLIK